MKKHKILTLFAVAAISLSTLSACGSQNNSTSNGNQNVNTTREEKQVATEPASSQKLGSLNYKSGTPAYTTVDHNHATLSTRQWKRDHVDYANLDSENRTSHANVGTLDKQNVANDSLRVRQTVQPTGYHQKFVNNNAILNRGHMIAYSLSKGISQKGNYNPKAESGDQNNPKNLFSQTAFSNQEVQTIYESKVRNALRSGEKVIYSVQPVFQGNDKMAKGVHMMALSTNHRLNFNVYIFNVQPGMQFNYADGTSKVNKGMKVPTPAGAPHFNDNNRDNMMNRRGFRRSYRRGYYPRRRHHFVRDAALLYGAHHLWKNHKRNQFYRRYHRPVMRRGLFHRHSYRHF